MCSVYGGVKQTHKSKKTSANAGVWPSEKINRAWARSACAEMHASDRSQAYVEKLLSHPAMIEGEQDALNEKVRDNSYDIEIENMGLIIQDLPESPHVSL